MNATAARRIAALAFLAAVFHLSPLSAQDSRPRSPSLGQPIKAPLDPSNLPGQGARPMDMTAPPFTVNGTSREQVRQFYNAVYNASEGIPIDSTSDTANCVAGTESAAFQSAELWRINWFRAMGGLPAGITFYDFESAEDQEAALMMSANNQLLHTGIPSSWQCFTSGGDAAAQESNLALGLNGPDAITGYVWDYGTGNDAAGHRRWILYPQTQIMAAGDVPAQGNYAAANATWVLDNNFNGPRPETTWAFVSWPPPGFVPYQVVYPRWSFALSNADLSAVSVNMTSNGVPVSITLEPYVLNFGENTVVWYPSVLDPDDYNTLFPFNGSDTVYSVTVANVQTGAGPQSFSYNVTVFDPSVAGPDSVPTLVSGTNAPSVNENNPYSCNPSANPDTSGYQWLAALTTNGDLADKALDGLTHFTISPPPAYSIITNPPVGSGKCFHLTHTNAVPQLLQFTEILVPSAKTTLSFQSLLGYATSNEVARVQISTNSGLWVDIYTQAGTDNSGQAAFAAHTLSLSNCAGQVTLLRFNYDYTGGSYYSAVSPTMGWCLEDIVLTNATQLIDLATNAALAPDFNFVPNTAGNWVLAARPVIFNQFGLEWSPIMEITAVTNRAPTLIFLGSLTVSGSQAQVPFFLTQGAASSFDLLQASALSGPWSTNGGTVLTTLAPGNSFQFTTPITGDNTFFKVQAR